MADAGVERALAFFTSAFSCYSGCRQYRENVWVAQQAVGPRRAGGAEDPDVLQPPGLRRGERRHVRSGARRAPGRPARRRTGALHRAQHPRRDGPALAATRRSSRESARLVAERGGRSHGIEVVYQSRSGPPAVPWLEPDVCDRIRGAREPRASTDGRRLAARLRLRPHRGALRPRRRGPRRSRSELGLTMVRAETVGTHPRFVAGDPRADRRSASRRAPTRPALGDDGPSHDVCPVGCCLPGNGRPSPWDVEPPRSATSGRSPGGQRLRRQRREHVVAHAARDRRAPSRGGTGPRAPRRGTSR